MKRKSGILLHITSLSSPYGIGDFGKDAYNFVDFLNQAKQQLWAILPLNIPDDNGSPYTSISSMARNWQLISPELLSKNNLLDKKDLPNKQKVTFINFKKIKQQKRHLLNNSFQYFQKNAKQDQLNKFNTWKKTESYWLDNFAFFIALKNNFSGKPWWQWPISLANRQPQILTHWQKKLKHQIDYYKYEQWLFHTQWFELKKYANKKGIKIFGDLPFFVAYDSVDVWVNKNLFLIDKKNKPRYVSGAPPDYFSKLGQVWDDPQYNWKKMEKNKFNWWIRRFKNATYLYDLIRLDHFRGYQALWHIPINNKVPEAGKWKSVPGYKLFNQLKNSIGKLPIVAEDLGTITRPVIAMRNKLKLPGMRVMLFGLTGDMDNFHLPKNWPTNCVAYTGTHDSDTARGWIKATNKKFLNFALSYLKANKKTFSNKLIKLGMMSSANTFITPMQDLLNLDNEARMNKPSTNKNNWQWRMGIKYISKSLTNKLRKITLDSKR